MSASSQSSKDTIAPCEEKLKGELFVFDEEGDGARHFDKKSKTLHIVQTELTDSIVIYYTGSDAPAELKVTKNGNKAGSLKGEKGGGGTTYKIDVCYEERSESSSLWQTIRPHNHLSTEYRLSGIGSAIKIIVKQPDQWLLKVKFPPVFKHEVGAKWEQAGNESHTLDSNANNIDSRTTLVKTSKTTSWIQSDETTVRTVYNNYAEGINPPPLANNGVVTEQETTSTSVITALTLERNSKLVTIDVFEVVGGIFKLISSITQLIKAIQDNAPKVGWYFKAEFGVFEGPGLELAWGWREVPKRYESYYYNAFACDVTLLNLMLEMGFGVDVYGCAAQICVKFQGKIGFKSTLIELEPPAPGSKKDKGMEIGTAKGVIEVGGYIIVKAGDWLEVVGSLVSSISVTSKVKLSEKKGAEIDGDITWDGLKAAVTVTTQSKYHVSKRSEEFVLADPVKFKDFSFPEKKPTLPTEYKTVAQITPVFVKEFERGLNLRVKAKDSRRTRGGKVRESYTAVDLNRIAILFAEEVWQYRDKIRVDAKTIQGISKSVRVDLDKKAERFGRDWVDMEIVESYLDLGEFEKVLDLCVDPSKVLMNQLSNANA